MWEVFARTVRPRIFRWDNLYDKYLLELLKDYVNCSRLKPFFRISSFISE